MTTLIFFRSLSSRFATQLSKPVRHGHVSSYMRRAKLSSQPCRNEHLTRKLSGFYRASSDPKGPHLKAVVTRTDGTSERRTFTAEHYGQRSAVSRAGHMLPR
jgi:hypothetical protein